MKKQITKKVLSALLTVVMLLSAVPLGGLAGLDLFTATASAATYGVIEYEIENGEVTITGCDENASGEIIIPTTIDDYPVTEIGWNAFRGCKGLTSINIGNSVTRIGDFAFYECTSLASITIPNSVITICHYAFARCTSLTSIIIPNSVTSIEQGVFFRCIGLTNITIPNSVTSICDSAFADCTGLTSITIPNSVTSIGDGAFAECTNLKSITIPDNVTCIDDYAFSHCTGLTIVSIGKSVTSIGDYAFDYCTDLMNIFVSEYNLYYCNDNYGVLYNKNKTELIKYPVGNTRTSFSIPTNVKRIGCDAFESCKGLTSITIPNSVTSIGTRAFEGCKNLTSITIPNSVTSIGGFAFSVCTSLTSIIIPDSVTNIGADAFRDCCGLTSISIGNSVTSIGYSAFGNCTGLTNILVSEYNAYYCNDNYGVLYNKNKTELVQYPIGNTRTSFTIPNRVTSIMEWAFRNCKNLKIIEMPNSITSIEWYSFSDCSNLTSVKFSNNVTYIGWCAFYNCTKLEDITIPDSVTSIGYNAFEKCTSLTSITIGNGVTLIDAGAFKDCKGLTSVTISNSVKKVDEYVFSDCTGLSSVTIPKSVTHIGDSAFGYYSIEENNDTNEVWRKIPNFKIYCYENSAGLEYAIENGFDYEIINTPIPATYTVEFYDGDVLLGSKQLEVGESSTLSYGSVPTKDGYTFIGWSNIKNGPALFNNGMPIENLSTTDGAVIKYYAVWDKVSVDSTVTDLNTGVEINIPADTYSGDVTLKVKEVVSGSSFNIVDRIENGIQSKVFSIETFVNGVEAQPNGFVTVKLPIPAGFNSRSCKLYYVNSEENRAENIAFTIEGNYIVFTTNHFSHWAIVEMESKLVSIEIASTPNTTQYNFKADVSTAGLKVIAKYSDGSEEDVTNKVTVKDFTAKKTGDKTATVEFEGKTATFNYKVSLAWWQWIIKIVLFGWIWYY